MTIKNIHPSPSKSSIVSSHYHSDLPPLLPMNVKKRYRFDHNQYAPPITSEQDQEIPRFFPSSWSLLRLSCDDALISRHNSPIVPAKSKKPKMIQVGEVDTSQELPVDAFSSPFYLTTEPKISKTKTRDMHSVSASPQTSSSGTRSKSCIDFVSLEDIPPLPFGPWIKKRSNFSARNNWNDVAIDLTHIINTFKRIEHIYLSSLKLIIHGCDEKLQSYCSNKSSESNYHSIINHTAQ